MIVAVAAVATAAAPTKVIEVKKASEEKAKRDRSNTRSHLLYSCPSEHNRWQFSLGRE